MKISPLTRPKSKRKPKLRIRLPKPEQPSKAKAEQAVLRRFKSLVLGIGLARHPQKKPRPLAPLAERMTAEEVAAATAFSEAEWRRKTGS